ncbi:hypothetical protein D3C86_1070420 [compost metagenome]
MLPLLDRGEAAADHAFSALANQCGSRSGFIARVLGAIFVAGQVVAIAVAEAFGHLHQAQRRCQCGGKGVAAIEQLATVSAVQPAPQRLLRRRIVHADAGHCRKHPQPFDVAIERLDQGFTETDHCRLAVHQMHQLIECRRQFSSRFESKEHVAGVRRNRGGENARLVVTHVNSFRKSAKFNRSTGCCVLKGQKSRFKNRLKRSTLEAQDPNPCPLYSAHRRSIDLKSRVIRAYNL